MKKQESSNNVYGWGVIPIQTSNSFINKLKIEGKLRLGMILTKLSLVEILLLKPVPLSKFLSESENFLDEIILFMHA